MSLRCVYTDLDGTLLGAGASLFTDHDGGFSMMQARALEACHRAGIAFESSRAHSALYDAEKTAELFCDIVNRWQMLP